MMMMMIIITIIIIIIIIILIIPQLICLIQYLSLILFLANNTNFTFFLLGAINKFRLSLIS